MLKTFKFWLPEAHIIVLCMDSQTHEILSKLDLPGVTLLTLDEVENEDLLRVKKDRSIAEYCWTLSASLCWHLMSTEPKINQVTYLDADLMFFSNVQPILDEMAESSITIIEHRFPGALKHLESYGRFNVEWVSFKRDIEGIKCLKKWRDQCIEWCFARLENGKLGDQKYLDSWPQDYQSVCILEHKGAGVAPWNYSNYLISERDGSIYIDDKPLIFYHFNQFQILSNGAYDYVSSLYSNLAPVPQLIYSRYERDLELVLNDIRQIIPGFSSGIRNVSFVKLRRFVQFFFPIWLKNNLRKIGFRVW